MWNTKKNRGVNIALQATRTSLRTQTHAPAPGLLRTFLLALTWLSVLVAPAIAANPFPTPDWTASGGNEWSRFGLSVCTAGDVNGDGRSDLIVGAPTFSWGQMIGQVRVYHGGQDGLNAGPAWSRVGSMVDERYGQSVSTAGDINGDGYDDIVTGAPYHTESNEQDGQIRIFLGSANGLVAAPSREYAYGQHHSWLGWSVAGGGDLNGDGYDDYLAGAPLMENGDLDEGILFVFHGGSAGPPPGPNLMIDIDVTGAQFGSSVAIAGDVNGDGFDDVVAGAPAYGNANGAAYLYLGSATGLGQTPVWTMTGGADTAFGSSVAGAGDVNGDGYADIVIGAKYYDSPTNAGRAFLYLGGPSGPSAVHAWTATLGQASSQFGSALATGGDFDGDGYADVVVGAPYFDNGDPDEGTVRLYRGSSTGLSVTSSSFYGGQGDAAFGSAVATAGDVNGDGLSDLAVGACFFSGSLPKEGRVFVYHGQARLPSATPDWTWNGPNTGYLYQAPRSVCSGDFNGDGESDVAFGDPSSDSGVGRVSAFFGSETGLFHLAQWTYIAAESQSSFGRRVIAGDLNGDGFDELIVGAPGLPLNGSTYRGKVHIFRGGPFGLSSTPERVLEGEEVRSSFGEGLAWVGDLNRDGCGDLVVGAPDHDQANHTGKAWLYFGNVSTLVGPAPLTRTGATHEYLGYAVAGPCDINGDGYGDWVIGSPRSVVSGWYGLVQGFLGGPVLDFEPDWEIRGGTEPTNFGTSVAVGELTGDARSDIVVGEPHFWFVGSWSFGLGRVHAYSGTATGAESLPFWSYLGSSEDGHFGEEIACVGDQNADGLGELLVGHPGYSSSEAESDYHEGRVCLFRSPLQGLSWSRESNVTWGRLGSAIAAAGDVTADGTPDFLYAGDATSPSGHGSYYLNYGAGPAGPYRSLRQLHLDGNEIRLLGATRADGFRFNLRGRTAAGRDRVRIEYEVQPGGQAFAASETSFTSWVDTGAPVSGQGSRVWVLEPVTGMDTDTAYHWRVRTRSRSPFFPTTRWMSIPGNGGNEDDLLLLDPASAAVDESIDSESDDGPTLRLRGENPFRSVARLEYAISATGPVELAVFDVAGRKVEQLVAGVQVAGAHQVEWTPREGAAGRASGVYFLRLVTPGNSRVLRITRVE